ncbi:MAG: hypothetical protein ACRC02_15470 [Vogesella sp.]|uniref:hypothetical protein n=1 Tax=Vogesella sp. TaxID=1904252 RepID=UPI0011CCC0CF
MSRYFNKLGGFQRSPAGLESRLLALAPRCLVYGTLLLGSPICLWRLQVWLWPGSLSAQQASMVDILAISWLILLWTVVFTVALGAWIVRIMKGPAYVADAYPLADHPRPGSQPAAPPHHD